MRGSKEELLLSSSEPDKLFTNIAKTGLYPGAIKLGYMRIHNKAQTAVGTWQCAKKMLCSLCPTSQCFTDLFKVAIQCRYLPF